MAKAKAPRPMTRPTDPKYLPPRPEVPDPSYWTSLAEAAADEEDEAGNLHGIRRSSRHKRIY